MKECNHIYGVAIQDGMTLERVEDKEDRSSHVFFFGEGVTQVDKLKSTGYKKSDKLDYIEKYNYIQDYTYCPDCGEKLK